MSELIAAGCRVLLAVVFAVAFLSKVRGRARFVAFTDSLRALPPINTTGTSQAWRCLAGDGSV